MKQHDRGEGRTGCRSDDLPALLDDSHRSSTRILVLAAHPDDETIGASSLLSRFSGSHVAFLTDGAPRDPNLWTGGPYDSRRHYAATRRNEALRALTLAGISAGKVHWLRGTDQEALSNIAALAEGLAAILKEIRPDILITHPYEGGHPDHDSAALIAQVAAASESFPHLRAEMTSYHARDEHCITGEFLSASTAELAFQLSSQDGELKRQMLAAYCSQRVVLGGFGVDCERFRAAPEYDFAQPPHSGTLWYERLGWPMTGEEWRRSAARALNELSKPAHI
jgi:LmbE family N-acetylglucosaminyl deacetylase